VIHFLYGEEFLIVGINQAGDCTQIRKNEGSLDGAKQKAKQK